MHNVCMLLVFYTYIHVNIPPAGRGVEEAPAGGILGCHYTSIQPTQHGHHVVLDGPRHRKILEKLRSGMTATTVRLRERWAQPWDATASGRAGQPVFHVPEDGRTAKTCCYGKVRVWRWQRRQEVSAAASVLPGDQLTGVLSCEKVPTGPIATWKRKVKAERDVKQLLHHIRLYD